MNTIVLLAKFSYNARFHVRIVSVYFLWNKIAAEYFVVFVAVLFWQCPSLRTDNFMSIISFPKN
jgi:hypothetical protein